MRHPVDDIDRIYRAGLAEVSSRRAVAKRQARKRRSPRWVPGGLAAVVIAGFFALMGLSVFALHRTNSPAGSPGGPAATTSAVPWADLAPKSPSANVSAGTCSAPNLTPTPLTYAGLASGSAYFKGSLTLGGTPACVLADSLPATLLGGDGQPLGTAALPAQPIPTVMLTNGQRVSIALQVQNWCNVPTWPSDVVAQLGDGTSLRLHMGLPSLVVPPTARCPEAGRATYNVVVTALASTSPPNSEPFSDLAASITPTGSATQGSVYRYYVDLHNAGSQTVGFQSCPVYDEGLKIASGYSVAYELNCQAAQPVPPGGTETFEMLLNIPSSAPLGRTLLTWGLEGSSLAANTTIDIQ